MFCAISGEVPTEPMVSKKSGHLFEKRLIEKYLSSEDVCPVTGEPLSAADLMPLVAAQTARPRPITATSIPGLLSHFQNEWDSVMLEMHTLKTHLDSTRKELSQVLYQHDAACRVIARLSRERDEARALVGARQGHVAAATVAVAAGGGEGMDEDGGAAAAAAAAGISPAVLEALTAKGKELSKGRKKRPVPPTLASAADLAGYAEKGSVAPHASKSPGVTCLDLHPTAPLTVSGGVDKAVVVFDHAKGQQVASLAGHDKKVTAVAFHPTASGVALSGSADKTVKIWSGAGFGNCASVACPGEVTGLSVHPTGDYAAVSAKDGSWAFASLNYASVLETVPGGGAAGGYSSVCFHPDGLLLGLGCEASAAEIWDMKTQKKIHSFEGHGAAVNALDFSENGYYMASAAADGEVKLWDLRKLVNLKSLALPDGKPGTAVKFDFSGSYLGVGCAGGSVLVHAVKEWTPIATLAGHSKEATAVCFNRDATVIASASLDRTVKLWGK